MQRSKAIFSWSVTGLLTLMIVAAIGAMTIKATPNSATGTTQTSASAVITAGAPSGSNGVATTSGSASTGTLSQIPAGAVIVPAPTNHEANEDNESNEGREGNEHAVTATTVKKSTATTVKTGTTSNNHEGSGERD